MPPQHFSPDWYLGITAVVDQGASSDFHFNSRYFPIKQSCFDCLLYISFSFITKTERRAFFRRGRCSNRGLFNRVAASTTEPGPPEFLNERLFILKSWFESKKTAREPLLVREPLSKAGTGFETRPLSSGPYRAS